MVRYFTYVDEQTINSFYNQFDDAYDSEKKAISKEKSFAGGAKISLKNIILGLLDGEGQATYGFRRNINEELERNIKIEKKITRLIEVAKSDENSKLIIEKSSNKQLICGTVQVLEINSFLNTISKI